MKRRSAAYRGVAVPSTNTHRTRTARTWICARSPLSAASCRGAMRLGAPAMRKQGLYASTLRSLAELHSGSRGAGASELVRAEAQVSRTETDSESGSGCCDGSRGPGTAAGCHWASGRDVRLMALAFKFKFGAPSRWRFKFPWPGWHAPGGAVALAGPRRPKKAVARLQGATADLPAMTREPPLYLVCMARGHGHTERDSGIRRVASG